VVVAAEWVVVAAAAEWAAVAVAVAAVSSTSSVLSKATANDTAPKKRKATLCGLSLLLLRRKPTNLEEPCMRPCGNQHETET